MSNKYALVIGNTDYADPGLAQLTAPGKDAEDFARVLKDKSLCEFDEVRVLLNQVSSAIIEAIDEFFDQKKPDDLLVLYFSGHGVRDELGALYLAVKNTIRSRLRSTAIKSDYIREVMDQSRSRRQVLVLDCCNSGAFAQGTKAEIGGSVGTKVAFEGGYGRVILTASDSTQFAWEGDKVIGETDNSLFTHYLVEGLEGKADRDGDGHITVDELYEYAYEKVRLATPKQTPSKFSTKEQGKIILRQNIRVEDIKPIPLPDDLIAATKSSLPFVREGAVRQLEDLLKGKNLGLARSAREALEQIAEEDDSRTISRAAFQALEAAKQADAERLAKLEAERIAEEERRVREQAEDEQKAEAERIAKAKLESERNAKEEAEKLATEKAEKERLAKLESERLAEEKRLATEAEKERKAKAEAERLAAKKAGEDRLAKAKIEVDGLEKEINLTQLTDDSNLATKKMGSESFSNKNVEKLGILNIIGTSVLFPFINAFLHFFTLFSKDGLDRDGAIIYLFVVIFISGFVPVAKWLNSRINSRVVRGSIMFTAVASNLWPIGVLILLWLGSTTYGHADPFEISTATSAIAAGLIILTGVIAGLDYLVKLSNRK